MVRKKTGWQTGVFLAASLAVTIVFSIYLYAASAFPKGVDADTFGHLFKINYLYDSIKKGIIYPIYTEYWYNGMELFRYWPPMSYYIAAGFQFITGGNVINAFYLFAGFVYFLNMTGWLLLGRRENRIGIAFWAGNLFFFCPDNLRIFFAEGNIPRILITSLLPFIFYFVWEIIHYGRMKMLIPLAAVMWIATASHYMIAAMAGISIFLFCLIYGIARRQWRPGLYVLLDLAFTYLAAGIFLLPGLTGSGLTSQSSEASINTISQWAQDAVKSLDPFIRTEDLSQFYFGLAIFIIALLGVIAANRETLAGFATTLIIFVSTTTTVSTLVRLLPMSQVFWMQRFVPMAMCTFFLALLLWKKLKKSVIILFTLFMLIDLLPTLEFFAFQKDSVETFAEKEMEPYLLKEAVQLTENRLAVIDNSLWGSIPSWYLSRNMDEDSVLYSFGWAYQGAATMENIVSINESAEYGYYDYMFDRILELGNDTVLVYKKLIPQENYGKLSAAAEHLGYELLQEDDQVWLYRKDVGTGSFGTVKQYKNLAIGEHARALCYLYPQFGYGKSSRLEDYTAEELSAYEKVYISGFTYDDQEKAEQIILEAAENGVQIFIDMQHIPTNKLTGKSEFLDVYAQFVMFTERFPILSTDNGSQFKLDFKTNGYSVWNTVYLSGTDEQIKTSYYDNKTNLTYIGKKGNDNILFMGFNIVYYYIESGGSNLLALLNEIFEEEPGSVCETQIVPLEIDYAPDKVTIQSGSDNVNTNLAVLDCYFSEEPQRVWDNLIVVDKGTTVLNVRYTGFLTGLIATATGLICLGLLWGLVLRKRDLNVR